MGLPHCVKPAHIAWMSLYEKWFPASNGMRENRSVPFVVGMLVKFKGSPPLWSNGVDFPATHCSKEYFCPCIGTNPNFTLLSDKPLNYK